MHPIVENITQRVIERSKKTREDYLQLMSELHQPEPTRKGLSCGNLAHCMAGSTHAEKKHLSNTVNPNIAIVSAYNDMLSAHKTYEDYPREIREYALEFGATAQVAGGVPAMCDGITQGKSGMELSLFSRDVIALSTAIALSHNVYDGVLCLGICDKIVPGLLIGSLKFGYLPVAFVPGGPMESGISNEEKAAIRQAFADNKIDREALLKGEMASYHSPGTCTFYGTANSNQMLLEIMGLQLPGSSFVKPDSQHRKLLTKEITRIIIEQSSDKKLGNSLSAIISEKTIINAIVGLLATGGSTNHTIHLIAIARAAGILVNWDDFSELSAIVPLIARIYPNGSADINHFHAAGGMAFVIDTLLNGGYLHNDVQTILGNNLYDFTNESKVIQNELNWQKGQIVSLDEQILRNSDMPFQFHGGIKVLDGNIGRSVIKTSSLSDDHLLIEAPCEVFYSQEELINRFKAGELNKNFVAVFPYQGPKANGMPELHQLIPTLSVIQKKGFKVALVTDGRMSGASGKIPAAIHLTPEASDNGPIARIQQGDIIRLDAIYGKLECFANLSARQHAPAISTTNDGLGRELFSVFRMNTSSSEEGASSIL